MTTIVSADGPDSMDLHYQGELGPAKRSTSNALGEQWSFAAVVISAIMLPGRRCLFEGHPVLGDEFSYFASDKLFRQAH